MRTRFFLLPLLLLFCIGMTTSCTKTAPDTHRNDHIRVGVAADFDYLNPLLIQLSLSREVCTLVFPTLAKPSYNESAGTIEFLPAAAERWEFSADGMTARFFLKEGLTWEDGHPLTADDFAFSYRLYADPAVASTRQHYLQDLLKKPDGTIDFETAVQTHDSQTLMLRFSQPMAPEIILDHFNDLMPVAKHVFKDIAPGDIRSLAAETPVIGAGPFKVSKWRRQQELVLASNPMSQLPAPAASPFMSFIVIPEYTTRLTMLKSGQIDAMISAGGINPKDAERLVTTNPAIVIRPLEDRYFDSVVWLNIDGAAYRATGEVLPHPLFGDRKVRQAMTFAIDRQSIIDGFIGPDHVRIVNTSLSPAYQAIEWKAPHTYPYDPRKASELLAEAGCTPGPDGILARNGQRFSFTLAAPVGNPRRNYAATIIQENLRQIGIECNLRIDENLVFLKNQNEYRYDAALSGLAAETLPFQLIIWGSDFRKHSFNSSAFQHAELDNVIARLQEPGTPKEHLGSWHRYQEILHVEQPRTFLYYYDELEGFRTSVKHVELNMLSTLYNAHEWRIY